MGYLEEFEGNVLILLLLRIGNRKGLPPTGRGIEVASCRVRIM